MSERNLSNLQFSKYNHRSFDQYGMGIVHAHDGPAIDERGETNYTNVVAKMSYGQTTDPSVGHPVAGRVDDIWVHPEYRRAGVASALYDFAKDNEPRVHHSSTRTEAGDAWAQSRGAAPATKRVTWEMGVDGHSA